MQTELILVAVLGSIALVAWLTDRGRDNRSRHHRRSYRSRHHSRGGGFGWQLFFAVILIVGIITFLPLIPLP